MTEGDMYEDPALRMMGYLGFTTIRVDYKGLPHHHQGGLQGPLHRTRTSRRYTTPSTSCHRSRLPSTDVSQDPHPSTQTYTYTIQSSYGLDTLHRPATGFGLGMSVLPDSLDNVVLGSMGEDEIEGAEFSLHSATYSYT